MQVGHIPHLVYSYNESMKIAIKTLGCKVNQYESEMLKERFKERGYEFAAEDQEADVFVINSCSVTNLSDRKSRQMARAFKKQNKNAMVVMTGCYAQLKPEEVLAIREVDVVTGTNHKEEIVDLVEEQLKKPNRKIQRVDSYEQLLHSNYVETGIIRAMEARSRAYIKIEEGCNRYCSYCIIPFARGRVRSRDIDNVVLEARKLLEAGFKEIVLTGINTALYGMDKNANEFGLLQIMERLEDLPYEFRVRIGSLEPTVVDAEHAQKLLKFKKLCPHFHLSVQSGSDRIIREMNRHYTVADYLKIVDVLRAYDEGFGITTDIIAGFPGETELDFAESLELIEKVEFAKVHAFRYSKRSGTKAEKMQGQIRGEIKNSRVKALIDCSTDVACKFFKKQVGSIRTILCERFEDGYLEGYTENYIKTYIPIDECRAKELYGNFLKIKLTKPFQEGMVGEEI